MVTSTLFRHHPVKILKTLFLNDGETAKIEEAKRITLVAENSLTTTAIYFNKAGDLVIQPVGRAGVIVKAATRELISINSKNLSCSMTIQ